MPAQPAAPRRPLGGLRFGCAWRRLLLATAVLLGADHVHAEFTTAPITTASVGQPYVYDVEAGGRGRVDITAPDGLPDWLTLETTGNGSATLSGTPTLAGVWPVTLRAVSNSCRFLVFFCATQEFDITVGDSGDDDGGDGDDDGGDDDDGGGGGGEVNTPPAVVPPGLTDQAVPVNGQLTLDVASAFADPDGDVLAFAATGLPPGLTLNGSTIVGSPSSSAGSPYRVRVTAYDGRGGTVFDDFLLTVTPLDVADLRLDAVAVTPAPALPNEPLEWTFTIRNAGPSSSGNFDLRLDFAGNPLTFEQHECTSAIVDERAQLDCTAGPIAQGETQTVVLRASAATIGDVHVDAAVRGAATVPVDPDASNNDASLSLNVGEAIAREPAQVVALGGATAIATGDLDADGWTDAAVATNAGAPTALLRNTDAPAGLHSALAGSGGERRGLSSTHVSLGDGGAGQDIVLADFDNDLDLDVVVAYGPGTPSAVFRNAGDGTVTQLTTLGGAGANDKAVAVGDVNGDGYADIVVAGDAGGRLFLNQGGGGFAAARAVAGSTASFADVALADVVGSALPDLIVAANGAAVTVHENVGGDFAPATIVDPGPASSIATGDFNGDGYADLVLGRSASGANGVPSNPVYLASGTGTFTARPALGATPTVDVVTGDIDGDGALDIVAVNATGAHQLFLGAGNGDFAPHGTLLLSDSARRAAIASIGRLQAADVIFAGARGIDVFFNDGTGRLGVGDSEPPVIELIGTPEIIVEVDRGFTDPGANATDNLDPEVIPIAESTVNPSIIGSYTVTYTAMDSAGNAALPVTRTVRVDARAATGGGGGSTGLAVLIALLVCRFRATSMRHRRS